MLTTMFSTGPASSRSGKSDLTCAPRDSVRPRAEIAIARAVVHAPKLLFADEPTGNLDSANAKDVLDIFRGLNRDHGQTIVMITHNAEAAAVADRVVRMRDGRLVEGEA